MTSLSSQSTGIFRATTRVAFCFFTSVFTLFAGVAVARAQAGTAIVRHAPILAGYVDGSVQQLTGENVILNDRDTVVSGDLLVPGLPTVLQNGRLHYEGTLDGTGATTPANFKVVLGSGLALRHVVRRTDPVPMPVVATPALPSGTRSVTLRFAGQSAGDFSTLRNLSVQEDVGQVAVPAGTYGNFTANDDSAFVLGVVGASTPSIYNFQKLTLNGGSRLLVVGPVIVNLASGLALNRDHDRRGWHGERHERFHFDRDNDYDVAVGSVLHPEWLVLKIASGGLKLDQNDSFHGFVIAPVGAVFLEDHSSLVGGVMADRLSINDRSRLRLLQVSAPVPVNQAPSVSLTSPTDGSSVLAMSNVTLQATATDSDGTIAKVEFYQGSTLLGISTSAPYQFAWSTLPGGSYTLTAKATDNLGASSVSAPVTLMVDKLPASIALLALNKIYDGFPAGVGTSSVPVDVPMVVTYNGSTELPVNAGSYDVLATVTSIYYYGEETGIMDIAQATPHIGWNTPADIVYGTPLSVTQLNATANVPGTFTYTPAAGTVLGAGASQALNVTFVPTDSVNYTTVSASTTINVAKSPAIVSLGGLSATYDGTAKNATFTTLPGSLSVVVTYNGSSTVPKNAGSYTVVAMVNDANYAGSATGTLIIAKAAPVVSWNAPADLVYGTSLSATQLNATADVFGSFNYTPAAGTVLNAGTAQTLSAVFTPLDVANYTTASTSTTINVTKAPALVTLGGLSQTYDGAAKSATALTLPLNLNVVLAYDGASTLPTNAGSYAVVATVDDPNYTGSAADTLVITKAVPLVVWPVPSDIVVGTVLSSTQLNAATSVPGLFTYNPASGTVLSAGAGQSLSATFIPTDSSNYDPVSVSNTINVLAPVAATIALDGVSSTTSTVATSSLTWSHSLTADVGSNRVLIVGVVTRGSGPTKYGITSVTFNGQLMTSLSASIADAGSGTYNHSQQFYLLDASLPPAGTYPVVVTFVASQTTSNGPSAGAISLANVAQVAPAGFSHGTGLDALSVNANNISTTVPAATGSWVVDNIGVGSSGANLLPTTGGMVQRYNITQTAGIPTSGAAGSTQVAGVSGSVTMSWKSSTARVVHSVAVFTPAMSIPMPPSVTIPPASQTVNAGDNVSFTVAANGTSPLTYLWFKDSLPISGATSITYALTNVQPADAGSYSVKVTNGLGYAISLPATLTVNTKPPVITTQPLTQTVNLGDNATLSVVATGTAPMAYQWYKDNVVLSGATASTLTVTNAQISDGGSYQVTIGNVVTTVTSDPAVVTINTAPVPPTITKQPAAQSVGVGSNVTFAVTATGTAPLLYQWQKDGIDIPTATASSLTLTNVQYTDAGSFQVIVSNIADDTTSSPVTLTVNSLTAPSSLYNLTGFATLGTGCTGGGVVAESDATYRKVYSALDLAQAIKDSKTAGAVKVIEIMNDLDLGWNELDPAAKSLPSTPFRSHIAPKLHPRLLITGVSLIDIQSKPGLTIFSANGATIRHATFNFKGTSNIIVRNLRFDEMWEWDESSKGNYDDNDWDFIDLSNGSAATNVWIDHCTFTKSYDGILDMKAGTQYVTMSWCKYVGDDGATNSNSFVRQQIAALEANKSAYPFYNFLRSNGFSTDDIIQIQQGHDKCHLLGSNALDVGNATLSATFHHQWFRNIWDRCVPRLRAGQVHNYNIYVDDTDALIAKRLRDTIANVMTSSAKNTLNNTYSFNPPLNGSISTEGGAILVENSVYKNCLWPLRNNQTDVTNPAYTGKILATNTIYTMLSADGTTTTTVQGNSTDSGNPLGPLQAPIIPFSWNTYATVPYVYTLDDPTNLQTLVNAGAGAGKIAWSKDNWLKISY